MKALIQKRGMAMLLAMFMAAQSWQLAVPSRAEASGALPAGWTAATMNGTSTGTAIVKQEASSYSSGQFRMEAVDGKQQSVSGEANGDTVYFLYLPVEGDFTITARIASVDGPPNGSAINSHSRVALMVKNGVSNTSASFTASYFPSVTEPDTGTLGYYRRFATNNSGSNPGGVTAPVYLKLQKSGNTFTAAYSADGETYNNPYTTHPDTGTMTSGTLNVGLAVTHASAVFDHVKIINASGGIVFDSTSANPDPEQGTAPDTPAGLQAVAGNQQVSLSWLPVDRADTYTVSQSTYQGGPYTVLQSGIAGTAYVDTAVSNGTTYYYVVRAVNAYGESGNSIEQSATPDEAAVVVPVGSITVSSLGGSAITVLGGTLQMQADVLPSHASNATVTWSVYEADGFTATDKAVISASGLLQAAKDGTVLVVAQAVDGSGVQGSMAITITGQKAPGIPEDVDGSQVVDVGDLGIVAGLFGLTSGSPNWEAYKTADVNQDNIINELDLRLVADKIE